MSCSCCLVAMSNSRYYWEPDCFLGMKGCLADGINVQCRFCGSGDWAEAWQMAGLKKGYTLTGIVGSTAFVFGKGFCHFANLHLQRM